MQIDFTRLLIARALSKVLKGEKGWPEVPLAKLQWGYISLWLAELALDVLGPTGALLKGAPGRRRRRHVGPQLRVAALHDDRRRPHRGPEEHHRRPRPQARTLTPALTNDPITLGNFGALRAHQRPIRLGGFGNGLVRRGGGRGRDRWPETRSATSFPEIGPRSRPLAPWPVATNTLSTPGSVPSRGESSRLVGRNPTRTSPSVALAESGHHPQRLAHDLVHPARRHPVRRIPRPRPSRRPRPGDRPTGPCSGRRPAARSASSRCRGRARRDGRSARAPGRPGAARRAACRTGASTRRPRSRPPARWSRYRRSRRRQVSRRGTSSTEPVRTSTP